MCLSLPIVVHDIIFFGGGFYFNVKYTVLEKIQLECYIFGVMNIIILDESTSKIDNF